MKTVHNKLVRDKVPQIIRANGGVPVCRCLDEREYLDQLRIKLMEETAEFLEENDPMELADLYEVLDALAEILGGKPKIMRLQEQKRASNGGFSERIFLQEVQSAE